MYCKIAQNLLTPSDDAKLALAELVLQHQLAAVNFDVVQRQLQRHRWRGGSCNSRTEVAGRHGLECAGARGWLGRRLLGIWVQDVGVAVQLRVAVAAELVKFL